MTGAEPQGRHHALTMRESRGDVSAPTALFARAFIAAFSIMRVRGTVSLWCSRSIFVSAAASVTVVDVPPGGLSRHRGTPVTITTHHGITTPEATAASVVQSFLRMSSRLRSAWQARLIANSRGIRLSSARPTAAHPQVPQSTLEGSPVDGS
jgi:hypothetical protein